MQLRIEFISQENIDLLKLQVYNKNMKRIERYYILQGGALSGKYE